MSLNLVSPGVKVREVDLTVGRIDAVNDQVGAIAGPFARGPINVPVLVETEQDLVKKFGKPSSRDAQYEYWLTASSYLSYGGTLRVIRTDDDDLVNAHAPVAGPVSLKIKSQEDYINNYQSPSDWLYASKEAGSWSNDVKVCVIDAAADQRISIGTFGLNVGYAITCGIITSYVTSAGAVENFTGYIKGIITKVNEGSIDVKIVSRFDVATGISVPVTYSDNALNRILAATNFAGQGAYYQIFNNVGVANSLEKVRFTDGGTVGVGSTVIEIGQRLVSLLGNVQTGDLIQTLNSEFKTRVVGVTTGAITVETAAPVSFASTTLVVTYTRNGLDGTLGYGEGLYASEDRNAVVDWYEQQTLGLDNTTVYWKNIAPKPGTSQYASERSSLNDEMHVVVVDDKGSVSGVAGNILEKFTNLSKASDARISPSENIYYKDYLSNNSQYIYAGTVDSITGADYTSLDGYAVKSGGSISWGQETTGINFGVVGSKSYTLTGGVDYGSGGAMSAELSKIMESYEILSNPAEYRVNFIIGGPSGGQTIFEAQAKANRLISIAEARKDCVVTISPERSGVINVTNSDTQTNNIIKFYDSVPSSSYAVFDSGYKYMFDRFNNVFRYIPLNGDIAGLMARTSINNYPWFSPAGSSRGTINNAVKLAYNPTQAQRDLLYPKRINPVIFSPGSGIILFGDKTGLSYASAFDRINVRRLFLTIEETIQRAARAQLFEFNDVITRTNFVNIVEPYLRDVKAKRGITDFLVVCDESNNTPDVIDANQFRADIFVKPARSINFIGLTFVANRTGVSFEEVVGTV